MTQLAVKSIKQITSFKVPPARVYAALMNSNQHAAFTGAPAAVSKRIGGRVTAYGDYIEATNIVLLEDRRIVQAWRAKDWPKGHCSRATFALKAVQGGGTQLTFTQTGVPMEHYRAIAQGWHEHYWTPLRDYFDRP